MTHINQRRDSAANWTTINPVLQRGEVGWEEDTRLAKLGDGVTAWNSLLYTKAAPPTAAEIGLGDVDNTSDMDKPVSTAQQALIIDSIADGDTTHAPSRNAVYDALAANVTASQAYVNGKITNTVTNGDTTHVPTGDAVADAITAATSGVAFPGVIVAYAGSVAPAGWALCNGVEVSRTSYAALFAAIGTSYGVGDGSTTFNLPNLKGRVPVGVDSAQVDFQNLGKTGGEKTHALTEGELPAHDHDFGAGAHVLSWGNSAGTVHMESGTTGNRVRAVAGATLTDNGFFTVQNADGWANTLDAGSNTPHNNLQPYVTTHWLIKVS